MDFIHKDSDGQREGMREAARDMVKEEEMQREKFNNLVTRSRKILFRATTVFPFDFFPDEIVIDESKVNLVIRIFFFTEQVHSVPIASIKDFEVGTGIFFGNMSIVPDGYPGGPIVINWLKKGDAMKVRRIIQGLFVGHKGGLDFSKFDPDEIGEKVEELGKVREVE